MASALNQLIAQNQGPDVFGSAMKGLALAGQEKQQGIENQMSQQRLSMGQKQLAMADQEFADKQVSAASKKIANVAYAVKNAKTPQEANAIYQQALKAEAARGSDVSTYPPELNEQAMGILDYHYANNYGDEMIKADLARKPQGPESGVGKLMADRAKAIKDGASPETIAAYDDAIKKENYIAPPKAAGSDDGYHPPVMTSTGVLGWDPAQRRYVPMMDGNGKPYLPQGVDPTVQGAVAGAKARGKEEGGATGEAVVQAALVGQNVAEIQSTIDMLRNHKGVSGITGMMGAVPNVPGSEAADAEALREQLGGRAFLQARQALKGGGQITDFEGQKAEQAFVRMQKAQSKKQFLAALDEYEKHVKNGYEILRKQSKGDFSIPDAKPTQPAANAEDQAAIDWANANPNDPRAAQIKQLHGVK